MLFVNVYIKMILRIFTECTVQNARAMNTGLKDNCVSLFHTGI